MTERLSTHTQIQRVPGATQVGWQNNHLERAELCFKNSQQFCRKERDAGNPPTLKGYGDRKGCRSIKWFSSTDGPFCSDIWPSRVHPAGIYVRHLRN